MFYNYNGDDMKSIMSINFKFFEKTPSELVNFVLENSKYLDGFEICVNYINKYEIDYMFEIANLCKKHSLHFQVHGDSSKDIDTQINFLESLYSIYDILGYPINVVLHPITDNNHTLSTIKTIEYTSTITEIIDSSKIQITLENLNDDLDDDRLNKEDITPIVCNNEKLFFTYDIGHEIDEYGAITDLNKEMIPLIKNIHLHSKTTNYDAGFDHDPIREDDPKWNEILKGILFLKNNHYDGTIVFEYNLYKCIGDTLDDKIKDYLKSMDFVSLRFK